MSRERLLPHSPPIDADTRADWDRRGVRCRLAVARQSRGLSQERLAPAVGLSLATYRRLEAGQIENPPLRYLVNCALALGVELPVIIEDEWCGWAQLKSGPATEPDSQTVSGVPSPNTPWPPEH